MTNEKSPIPYTFDKQTNKMTLPADIIQELHRLISEGRKIEAIKRVREFTGAGLKESKDCIDRLSMS